MDGNAAKIPRNALSHFGFCLTAEWYAEFQDGKMRLDGHSPDAVFATPRDSKGAPQKTFDETAVSRRLACRPRRWTSVYLTQDTPTWGARLVIADSCRPEGTALAEPRAKYSEHSERDVALGNMAKNESHEVAALIVSVSMSQSLAQVYLHIVFSTKHRHPWFKDDGLRNELYAYMATILRDNVDSPAIIINGVEDHIHALIRLSRKYAIMKVVQEAKTETSKWLKRQPTIPSDFAWQAGYGTFSVSESLVEKVSTYIRNQEIHHQQVPNPGRHHTRDARVSLPWAWIGPSLWD